MADGNWAGQRQPDTGSEVVPTGLVLRLDAYWRSVLNGRKMPARCDIDPAGMRRLLPHVFLIDVVDCPPHFRWRLVGTKIGDVEHGEHTGKWVEATIRHREDPFLEFCRMTVEERRPTCHAALRADPDGSGRPLIRTLLPLSEDGRIVTMLLGAIDYAPGEISPLLREIG
jgi:hypothetical protein